MTLLWRSTLDERALFALAADVALRSERLLAALGSSGIAYR